MSIRSVDAGNFQINLIGSSGAMMIPSDLTSYYERDLDEETFGKYDFVVDYEDNRYFAGTLAQVENQFADFGETLTMFGDTKAHEDAKVRTVMALALSGVVGDVQVVVGQPISSHKKTEKEKIRRMLVGRHRITINGRTTKFDITDCAVATEGSSAYFAIDEDKRLVSDTVRIIDAGSGTVNMATIYKGKKTDKGSATLKFGRNTVDSSAEDFAKAIARAGTKLQWRLADNIFVCGGSAHEITPTISDTFENTEVINPTIRVPNGVKRVHPVFANAVSYYEIARRLYR